MIEHIPETRQELDAWHRENYAKDKQLREFGRSAEAKQREHLGHLGLQDTIEYSGKLRRAEEFGEMLAKGTVLHRAERAELMPYIEAVNLREKRDRTGEDIRPTTAAGVAIDAVAKHGGEAHFAASQIARGNKIDREVLAPHMGTVHTIAVEEATDAGYQINVRVEPPAFPGPDFVRAEGHHPL